MPTLSTGAICAALLATGVPVFFGGRHSVSQEPRVEAPVHEAAERAEVPEPSPAPFSDFNSAPSAAESCVCICPTLGEQSYSAVREYSGWILSVILAALIPIRWICGCLKVVEYGTEEEWKECVRQ